MYKKICHMCGVKNLPCWLLNVNIGKLSLVYPSPCPPKAALLLKREYLGVSHIQKTINLKIHSLTRSYGRSQLENKPGKIALFTAAISYQSQSFDLTKKKKRLEKERPSFQTPTLLLTSSTLCKTVVCVLRFKQRFILFLFCGDMCRHQRTACGISFLTSTM